MRHPVLDSVLERLKPWDMDRLGRIYRPSDGRMFRHNLAFDEWIFCGCRKEKLYDAQMQPLTPPVF